MGKGFAGDFTGYQQATMDPVERLLTGRKREEIRNILIYVAFAND
jgi:hypothetical protein